MIDDLKREIAAAKAELQAAAASHATSRWSFYNGKIAGLKLALELAEKETK